MSPATLSILNTPAARAELISDVTRYLHDLRVAMKEVVHGQLFYLETMAKLAGEGMRADPRFRARREAVEAFATQLEHERHRAEELSASGAHGITEEDWKNMDSLQTRCKENRLALRRDQSFLPMSYARFLILRNGAPGFYQKVSEHIVARAVRLANRPPASALRPQRRVVL